MEKNAYIHANVNFVAPRNLHTKCKKIKKAVSLCSCFRAFGNCVQSIYVGPGSHAIHFGLTASLCLLDKGQHVFCCLLMGINHYPPTRRHKVYFIYIYMYT